MTALVIFAVICTVSTWMRNNSTATAGVLMCLVALNADNALSFFGLTSNYGNIWYAGVMYACAMRAMSGKHYKKMLLSVLALLAVFHIGLYYSDVPDPITDSAYRVVAASFLAFVFASSALYAICYRSNNPVRIVAAIVGAQCIDSLIFFPLAFMQVAPVGEWVGWMINGFVIKAALGLITFPWIVYVVVADAPKKEA